MDDLEIVPIKPYPIEVGLTLSGDIDSMKIIKLKIPSMLESLGFIEKALDDLKEDYEKNLGGTDFPLNQVKVATFEAFSNVVKHAHPNQPELEAIIQLTLEAEKIEVQILDCGKGFDFEKVKALSQRKGALLKQATHVTPIPEAGLGIFVITSLMDQVLYIPATDGTAYNQLVMVKYL